MSGNSVRYGVPVDRLVSVGLSVCLLLFVGLSIFSGEGWLPTAVLCVLILCSGMMAQARRNPLDLAFVFVVAFITAPSVVLLKVFPVVKIFEAGQFSDLFIEEATVEIGVLILCGIMFGWLLVQVFDPVRLRKDLKHWYHSKETDQVLIFWFIFSIAMRWWGAWSYGVNVAGVESQTTGTAIFYYLAPIDLIAPIFAFMLGFGKDYLLSRRALVCSLLIAYLALKVATGWKSAFLHLALAYSVGLYISGARVRVLWAVIGFVFILFIYIFAVRPVTEIVRTGEVLSHGLYSADDNVLSNRLTDSNFQGLWLLQARPNLVGIDVLYFLKDLINQMVPGSIFDARSFSWLFTQEILGQLEGIESTFAPGVIGTVVMIGGVWVSVVFGAFFRLLVLLFVRISLSLKGFYLHLLVYASLPIYIFSLVIDGYSGGFEKIIPGVLVFVVFLTIFKSIFRLAQTMSRVKI